MLIFLHIIHDKGLLGNGLPNQNTGSGDSEIINDASSKAISQTGESYALDTIAP